MVLPTPTLRSQVYRARLRDHRRPPVVVFTLGDGQLKGAKGVLLLGRLTEQLAGACDLPGDVAAKHQDVSLTPEVERHLCVQHPAIRLAKNAAESRLSRVPRSLPIIGVRHGGRSPCGA